MNILGLLERLEKQSIVTMNGYEEWFCFDCRRDSPSHEKDCELKATIDALRSGRLQVVDTQTAVDYTRIIIEKEQG